MMNLWDNKHSNNNESDDSNSDYDDDDDGFGFGFGFGFGGGGVGGGGGVAAANLAPGANQFETVPLTPRARESTESCETACSSTASSVASRSVYLSFFKSPSLTTPTSQNTTSLGGGYGCSFATTTHHHHHQTPGATTMLYPVRENFSTDYEDSEEDDEEEEPAAAAAEEEDKSGSGGDSGYYLSWQQQQYHDQQRRHSEQSLVATGTATTLHHRNTYQNRQYGRPSHASTNDSGSVFQSVHDDGDDDDEFDDDDDASSVDGLSILSSASHLFGENLVQANSRDCYDIEQGGSGRSFPPIPSAAAASASYYADPPTPQQANQRSSWWGLRHNNHYYGSRRNSISRSWTLPSWNNINFYNNWSSGSMRLTLPSALRTPGGRLRQQRTTACNKNKRKRLTLSPRSRNLQDLQYLTQQHQTKVQQLLCLLMVQDGNENGQGGGQGDGDCDGVEVIDASSGGAGGVGGLASHNDGYYDFAIILKPQEVYGFWASLLDFREELLGPDAVEAMESSWERNNRHRDNNSSQSQSDLRINSTDDTDDASLTTSPSSSSSGPSAVEQDNTYEDEDDDEMRSLTPRNDINSNSGLRCRRGQTPRTEKKPKMTPTATTSSKKNAGNSSSMAFTSPGIGSIVSRASTTTCPSTLARKSVFERAMGSPTSPEPPSSQTKSILPVQQRWLTNNATDNGVNNNNNNQQQLHSSFTSTTDAPSLSGGISTPAATASAATGGPAGTATTTSAVPRRRWGNQAAGQYNTPSMISPPIRSLTRGSSMHKVLSSSSQKPKKVQVLDPQQQPPSEQHTPDQGNANENDNPNILTMNDIPSQRFARGIANRTNGMLPFLSALKRGIVLRKHRPNKTAVYCKLYSEDGGDTIKYALVDDVDDAMNAFKEQRVRYNKTKYPQRGGGEVGAAHGQDEEGQLLEDVMAQPWSLSPSYSMESTSGDNNEDGYSGDKNNQHNEVGDTSSTMNDNKKFDLPDYVAAQQYRERQKKQNSIAHLIKTIAKKIVLSGTIRAQDIAVVHPATFVDPRPSSKSLSSGSVVNESNDELLGTTTFRRSKSEYDPQLSFSLVLRTDRLLKNGDNSNNSNNSIDEYENRWLTGQGLESSFQYHDFEMATIGEYWLVFRGFLLLHRDAAVGRYAEHRAAGIGSHYGRLELEQRQRERAQMNADDPHNRLHVDEFHEPATVGCCEKLVVKFRNLDTKYMEGYVTSQAKQPPPSDYFLGFKSSGTAIWSRLRQAGLETSRVYSLDPNRVMIKIRCPPERLMDVATVLRIKLPTKRANGSSTTVDDAGQATVAAGNYAPFHEDMLDLFESLDDPDENPASMMTGWMPNSNSNTSSTTFAFRSSIRQTIIDFIIGSRIRDSGAELSQNTDLGKMIQARVPLHMYPKLNAIYDTWFYFWRPNNYRKNNVTTKSASQSSEKEDEEGKGGDDEVPHAWKRFFYGCFHQPLDSIELYFGEKVAFYFAWLQHTASHLLFLTVAGLIVFLFQIFSGNWDHPLRPVFAIVVMLWTFITLVNWRKRANYLAYNWGSFNYKEQETTRPQFHGDYVLDPITGEWVVTYPKYKRYVKYAISVPLTLLFTAGSLFLIFWVHANRDLQMANYLEQKVNNVDAQFEFNFAGFGAAFKRAPIGEFQLTRHILFDPTFWLIMIGLPSILGLFLPLLNLILMKISVALNDFENYRTESEYRTWLIVKVFSFRFVCYFATLYYYAFVSIGSDKALANGLLRVATGVLIYTTVAQWWQNFLHVCFPIAIRKLRMRHRRNRLIEELRSIEIEEEEVAMHQAATEDYKFNCSVGEKKLDDDMKGHKIQLVNKRLLLEQAQDNMWLEVMLPQHDSFPEYIQAVVQFTYVSCFSVALPITPLIVLFNYLLCMRLDAYKLCKGRRRPLAEKTGGIGIWEHLLHIVAVISVLTNCWLMGFTNSTFIKIGETIGQLGVFAIVVGWEHVMLLIKYVMGNTVSPLPKSVRDALKHEQHEMEVARSNSMMQTRRLQHQREEQEYSNIGSNRLLVIQQEQEQDNTQQQQQQQQQVGGGANKQATTTPLQLTRRYHSVSKGFDNVV